MTRAGADPLTRGLSRASSLASAVLLLTAGTCYTCPPEPVPVPPGVAGIYRIPGEVWTTPGQTFTLRVRVLNAAGYALREDELGDLRWANGATTLATGTSSLKYTAPSVGPFPQNVLLTVSKSGYESATVAIHVTDGSSPDVIDWVAARHVDKEPPVLALIDGRRGGSSFDDELVAFVGMAPIGHNECPTFDSNCGEVTLFSRVDSVHREQPIKFMAGCDAYDLAGGSATFPGGCTVTRKVVAAAHKVPLSADRVYVLSADIGTAAAALSAADPSIDPAMVTPEDLVAWDIAYTHKVLSDGWTGLTFAPVPYSPPGAYSTDIVLGEYMSCREAYPKSVKEQLIEAGVTNIPDNQITVAYVGRLLKPDGSVVTDYQGITCEAQGKEPTIVLISWATRNGTVLAHEMMHALGPWFEFPWGHTNGVAGFNEQNILWEGETSVRTPRSLLTLGQAFRLNLDSYSIRHRGAQPFPRAGTFLCQHIASTDEQPCPRLAKDAAQR